MHFDLLKKIQSAYKNSDKKLIADAFEFAKKAHLGQKRASGEEYIVHPLHAALTLSEMSVDVKTVVAALLHDTLDDTSTTKEEIEKAFGKEVVFLVEGVSKLGKIKYRGVERHAENLRKMLIAMAQDFRVVLIKLADRYHNLQTLDALPIAKQKRIALESLEIYAPLAFRLGVSELSKKIEDLAFKYCYPQEYQMILDNVEKRYPEREKLLETLKPQIRAELIKERIKPIEIQTRAKHYWSLYEKLKKYNMNWDTIYDLIAMRIIVKDIEACYGALGVIHKFWRPLPGRIKDYIALPKPNGYQSLHTTVFCKEGNITEFQIRTQEMHDAAENGIAAHWLYTEYGKPKQGAKLNRKTFDWVRQIRGWQNEFKESSEFLEGLKIDIFSDRIFVFTPRGDVIDLPEGATPVDFAYAIHGTLGDTCAQAKVNSAIAPLDQPLKNGDMVEIIKNQDKHPSRDWLAFVKTSTARTRIKTRLKQSRREEKIKEGETLINKELERLNHPLWGNIGQLDRRKALQNLPYQNEQTLLAAVGEGDISPYRVIKYVVSEKEILAQRAMPKIETTKIADQYSGVHLAGLKGIATRIALCCSPLPGEKICAYVTKGAYAAIHKNICANFDRLTIKNPNRAIPASWRALKGARFVKIKITAFDRVGLVQEISSAISNMGINMLAISAEQENIVPASKHVVQANLSATLEVFDLDQLHLLLKNLGKIKSVRDVKRV